MTFLQPGVLLALPFVVLPLVIHLVHQRRFQTVDWAAMRFLLEARALARGHSRLKHWLVMALRMAAVAAAVSGRCSMFWRQRMADAESNGPRS